MEISRYNDLNGLIQTANANGVDIANIIDVNNNHIYKTVETSKIYNHYKENYDYLINQISEKNQASDKVSSLDTDTTKKSALIDKVQFFFNKFPDKSIESDIITLINSDYKAGLKKFLSAMEDSKTKVDDKKNIFDKEICELEKEIENKEVDLINGNYSGEIKNAFSKKVNLLKSQFGLISNNDYENDKISGHSTNLYKGKFKDFFIKIWNSVRTKEFRINVLVFIIELVMFILTYDVNHNVADLDGSLSLVKVVFSFIAMFIVAFVLEGKFKITGFILYFFQSFDYYIKKIIFANVGFLKFLADGEDSNRLFFNLTVFLFLILVVVQKSKFSKPVITNIDNSVSVENDGSTQLTPYINNNYVLVILEKLKEIKQKKVDIIDITRVKQEVINVTNSINNQIIELESFDYDKIKEEKVKRLKEDLKKLELQKENLLLNLKYDLEYFIEVITKEKMIINGHEEFIKNTRSAL